MKCSYRVIESYGDAIALVGSPTGLRADLGLRTKPLTLTLIGWRSS
jgi:hypothetical protein